MAFIVTGGYWEDQGYWETYSNPAFDAGARTVAEFTGDGFFTFSVEQATGIVCGLNTLDSGAEETEILYGFYLESGRVRIVERGVFKTAFVSYTPVTSVFRVERINGVVRYYKDGTLLYTSSVLSTGTVFLDCSLYAAGDTILGGALEEYAQLHIALTNPEVSFEEALQLDISLSKPKLILLENDGQLLFDVPAPELIFDEAPDLFFSLPPPTLDLVADEDLTVTLPSPQLILWSEDESSLYIEVPKPALVLKERAITPDVSLLQFSIPQPRITLNEEEHLSLDLLIPPPIIGLSDGYEYCHIELPQPLLGMTLAIMNFGILEWPQWRANSEVLRSTAALSDTLGGTRTIYFDTAILSTSPLSGVLHQHGTISDEVLGADRLNTVLPAPLSESQASSDALRSDERALLGDSLATTETLSGIRALHGTLGDSVATTDACSTGVDGAIADDQASSLTLRTALVTTLADSSGVSEALGGRSALHATVADAALSSELLRGHGAAALADSVTDSEAWVSRERSLIADSVAVTDALSGRGTGHIALAESVQVTERGSTQEHTGFSDSVTASDAVISREQARIADSVVVTDVLGGRRASKGGLADSASISDTLAARPGSPLAESQASSDALVGRVGLHGAQTESQGSTDTLSGVLVVYGALVDTSVSSDTLSGRRALLGVLADTAVSGDTFSQQSQTVYAINADTGAVSEYVFTPLIRGAAFVDGALFLATPDGLFALDATTDAGTAIDWELRTGFTAMGSDALKRVTDVNVLGESSGDVGVGLVTSRYGVKDERRYERVRLTRDASRDGVIKTGRGPVSVYWQVSVAGVGPAEINELRLSVEPLSRRR